MKQFKTELENGEYIIYDPQFDLDESLPLAKVTYNGYNQSLSIIPIELKNDDKKLYLLC